MRVCGIFLDAGSHKRLPVGYVPRGNWAYRLEFEFLRKSVGLVLNCCDVFDRLLLGIPSRSLKVTHYRGPDALTILVSIRHNDRSSRRTDEASRMSGLTSCHEHACSG